jgi:mannosidase alpha-like ER degradation enhancer 2
MFYHAYGNYKASAFPHDELKPLSCCGDSSFYGGLSLTMLDVLDTLAVVGDATNFTLAVDDVGKLQNFDIDSTVSVFETNIRVLGGLLAAHMLAADPDLRLYGYDTTAEEEEAEEAEAEQEQEEDEEEKVRGRVGFGSSESESELKPRRRKVYDGCLLRLARDVADRLLPAFDTPTGIPYGSINLRHGVKSGESTDVCTAAAGTFTLEFGVLTRLTGDAVYESRARAAARAIFALRSSLGLVGAHVNIVTGKWTQVR